MYFMDPDEGDTLKYTAESSNTAAATVSEPDADSMITITAVNVGGATITITATDSHEASATATFMVAVTPQNVAPVVEGIPDQSLEMDFYMMKTLDLSMYSSDRDSGPRRADVYR